MDNYQKELKSKQNKRYREKKKLQKLECPILPKFIKVLLPQWL